MSYLRSWSCVHCIKVSARHSLSNHIPNTWAPPPKPRHAVGNLRHWNTQVVTITACDKSKDTGPRVESPHERKTPTLTCPDKSRHKPTTTKNLQQTGQRDIQSHAKSSFMCKVQWWFSHNHATLHYPGLGFNFCLEFLSALSSFCVNNSQCSCERVLTAPLKKRVLFYQNRRFQKFIHILRGRL